MSGGAETFTQSNRVHLIFINHLSRIQRPGGRQSEFLPRAGAGGVVETVFAVGGSLSPPKKYSKKAHNALAIRRRNAHYFAESKASCPPQEKV